MALATEEQVAISRSPRLAHRPMYQAPEFSKRLNPLQEIRAGDTVVFECQFKAFPQPSVKWFKDDQEINTTETGDKRFRCDTDDSEGLLRLTVTDVTKPDEGAYKCKVENQEGVATTTGYLSVTGDTSPKSSSSSANGQSTGNKSPEVRAVSLPPHLRTIIEQKSLEEREEKQQLEQPSPFQPLFDGRRTWPLLQMGYGPGWTDERKDENRSSGSDTSVGSQDIDFGSFTLDSIPPPSEEYDDRDLHFDELDDEVFRKDPAVSLSSEPMTTGLLENNEKRDQLISSASSDLFVLEGDDLLLNGICATNETDNDIDRSSSSNVVGQGAQKSNNSLLNKMTDSLPAKERIDLLRKNADVTERNVLGGGETLTTTSHATNGQILSQRSKISPTKSQVNPRDDGKQLPAAMSVANVVRMTGPSLYTEETARLLSSDLMYALIILISFGTFVGTSLGLSPTYYVLLLSLLSIICFRLLSAE